MRASQWSGVIAWLAVLVIVLSVVGATCTAHGQCIGGMCPMPPNYGWRPSTPSGHYTQPRPCVCRIRNQIGRAASVGTGTLVCVGSDYGAVITCAHLFREGAGRITVTFPNGKTFAGALSARDRAGELAIVKITPRPDIPIARIATDHPVQGDRLTFAGYGPDGRYREVMGIFNGYRGTAGGKHQTLEVQGNARQGDSGGPIFNAEGELVGVLWGTDGSTTVGSYNGRICQFTLSDRYLFPWNADLAKEKYRHQNPPQTQPSAPPTSPGSPISDEIRQKLESLSRDVQSLRTDVAALEQVADAAKEAASKAQTEAGKAFAEAVGVKSEVGRAASAASVAQEQASAAKETAEKLDRGLLERVGGLVHKTADLATWDYELLPIELAELEGTDIDLGLIGFSEDELAKLLDPGVKEGLCDPDEVPEPPDEPITRLGDLWLLGEHRLLCGDAGNAEHVDRLLDGAKIHLVNTDPPYNVRVEPRSNNAIAAGLSSFQGPKQHQRFDVERHPEKANATHRKMRAKDRPLENDFVSDEEFDALLHAWFGNMARGLLPGHAAYIWGGYANCANYPPVLKACGLYFSQAIIWVKEHPVLTRKDFMGNHEWCFYCWREGAAHRFFGPNNAVDVWSVKKVNPNKMRHLTEKPVELAIRAIQYSSLPGENVLDLFGGSGSTLIACEQTDRRCYMMELDPLYCDVIWQRWEQFTGRKAERQPAEAEVAEVAS